MANNGKAVDGGQSHDGYPQVTKGDMADTDQSSITTGPLKAEAQAHSLIGLVLSGESPMKLMNRVIDQIHEEGGGPYHIGSQVKINTAGTYEKVGGGSVSLGYRDIVSIVNPYLGEQGKDALVLLSDGSTRAIVPFKALGESVGWLNEADVATGPDAFMMKPQTGSQLTADSDPQGDKEPSDVASAQSSGQSSPITIGGPSQVQGDSEADDEPSAAAAGSSAPSVKTAQAVEWRREILQALSMFMETATDADYRRLNEIKRRIESSRSARTIGRVHTMLFSENKQYSFAQVAQVVEADEPAKDTEDDDDSPFPKKDEPECKEDDDKSPFPKKDDDEEPAEQDDKDKPGDQGAGQFGASAEDDDEPKPLDVEPEEMDDPTQQLQPAEDDIPPSDDDDDELPPAESDDDDEDDLVDDPEKKTEQKLRRLYGEDGAGMTGDASDDASTKPKKDPKAGMTGDTAEAEDDDDDEDDDEPKVEADGDKPDVGKKDYTSPQGDPGKNPSAPGVKESKRELREGYKKAMSSMFRRLDEGRSQR